MAYIPFLVMVLKYLGFVSSRYTTNTEINTFVNAACLIYIYAEI